MTIRVRDLRRHRAFSRSGIVLLVSLLSIVAAGCRGGDAYPAGQQTTPTPGGVVAELARLAPLRPGVPVMVFVYTDG